METCKKLPRVVLAAVPYLYLAGVAAVGLNGTAFSVWLVIFLLLEVPNVAYAFLWPRWGGTVEGLLFWNMVIKLCHIPFFLLLAAAGTDCERTAMKKARPLGVGLLVIR